MPLVVELHRPDVNFAVRRCLTMLRTSNPTQMLSVMLDVLADLVSGSDDLPPEVSAVKVARRLVMFLPSRGANAKSLRVPLLRMIQRGIDLALKDAPDMLGLFDVLSVFLRPVAAADVGFIHSFLTKSLNALPTALVTEMDQTADALSSGTDPEWFDDVPDDDEQQARFAQWEALIKFQTAVAPSP